MELLVLILNDLDSSFWHALSASHPPWLELLTTDLDFWSWVSVCAFPLIALICRHYSHNYVLSREGAGVMSFSHLLTKSGIVCCM